MSESRISVAFRAAMSGPPFTTEARNALESLDDAERVELGRLIAKASGVPDGEFCPRTERERNAEVVAWTAAFEQAMQEFKASKSDEAATRVAVARADATVRKLAASGHGLKAITRSGCGGILLFAMAILIVAIASCTLV